MINKETVKNPAKKSPPKLNQKQATEFQNFQQLAKMLVSVPKAEIAAQKPTRRQPKPKTVKV